MKEVKSIKCNANVFIGNGVLKLQCMAGSFSSRHICSLYQCQDSLWHFTCDSTQWNPFICQKRVHKSLKYACPSCFKFTTCVVKCPLAWHNQSGTDLRPQRRRRPQMDGTPAWIKPDTQGPPRRASPEQRSWGSTERCRASWPPYEETCRHHYG